MRKAKVLNGRAIVLGLTAFAVLPLRADLYAQNRVEFIPFGGSYYAVQDLGRRAEPADTLLSERQKNVALAGASVSALIAPAFAIEAQFVWAPSGTVVTSGVEGNPSFSGYILYGSLLGRFHFPRSNLYLVFGGGVVRRGGEAWNFSNLTSLTDLAGVGGLGVRAGVTPSVEIDVRLQVQVYQFDPDDVAVGDLYEGKLQQDILLTIGIPIPIVK